MCVPLLLLQVLPKVKQHLEAAHRDVTAVAAEMQRGVERNMREMQVRSYLSNCDVSLWDQSQHQQSCCAVGDMSGRAGCAKQAVPALVCAPT